MLTRLSGDGNILIVGERCVDNTEPHPVKAYHLVGDKWTQFGTNIWPRDLVPPEDDTDPSSTQTPVTRDFFINFPMHLDVSHDGRRVVVNGPGYMYSQNYEQIYFGTFVFEFVPSSGTLL